MRIINKILDDYKDTPDLITRKIRYNFSYVYLFYIETICSSDRVNTFILDNITNPVHKKSLKNILAAPNIKVINSNEIEFYIYSGFTILIYLNKIYALETRADLDRSISFPEIEQDLYGAKDSLVENYQKNVGLIKKRIKSKHLKTLEYKLGRFSKSSTGLLYIDNIAKKEIVDKVDSILKNIDVDSIIDSGELKHYLIKEDKSFFPSVKLTERPDVIVNALLEGKIVVVMDTSPFAIVLPAVLADFINPISDSYLVSYNANILKFLRLICFFITIFTPAIYVAMVNYNQETIPSNLLTSFITQKQGVPFPAAIEAFFMLFICEMLRESDIRFPNNYSSSISILGALILGDAAVEANIVSPITIIVISLTFISSMIFSNVELSGAIRIWRFICLAIASFWGLFGVAIGFIFLIVDLCSYNSFNLDYTFPVAPFDFAYLKDTLIKVKKKNDNKRSKYLTDNIRKQR